ncbi:unnamed protein product, partial [Prorocentrum cordatum]
ASFGAFVGPLVVLHGVPRAAGLVRSAAPPGPWWQSEPNDLLRARHPEPGPGNGVQLATVDETTDPWLGSAGRDECSGCDFTVNMRCEGSRLGRHAACHPGRA